MKRAWLAVCIRALAAGAVLGGCGHQRDARVPEQVAETAPETARGRAAASSSRTAADDNPARMVNTFIGTATFDGQEDTTFNAGNVFPGAALPFGMVQFSPDTGRVAGGYRYTSDKIEAFSLTHFSGRGVACWLDVGILPTIGAPTTSPAADWPALASSFRHEHERASPGRYQVRLDDHGIDVELTATTRTGMARFTFPAGSTPTVLLNTGHSARGNSGTGTFVEVAAPNRIIGSAESGDCGGEFRYRVFFVAEFDRPFAAFGTWNGDTLAPSAARASGADTGAFVTFAPGAAPLHARIGLSFVSTDGAERNLRAENDRWDFDAVAAAAARAWNARLAAIEIAGGAADARAVFFTALYHTMLHPNVFSDTDGSYPGFDGGLHRAPPGHARYENFATWDSYRSHMPLLSIIAPVEVGDMMTSLVGMAAEDPGGGLPRWQQAAGNSGGMEGASQDIMLATAYAFGARGFDAAAALRAMDRGATVPDVTSGRHRVRDRLAEYLAKGYVPYDHSRFGEGSASLTLEYSADDFAIAQLAGALGDGAMRARYLQRAGNWRNVWTDEGGGLLAPRREDGTFVPGIARASGAGFVEGSAEQYSWMVPFDARRLIAAMGGPDKARARLDEHLRALNDGMDSAHAFLGNEPGEVTPWMYDFAGAPYRTQVVVRRILRELYFDSPRGLPGNDDGGALSSWVVFASMGLYPAIPGVAGFVVGSPRFREITVRLAHDHILRIIAPNAADANPYVRSLRLDGGPFDHAWIPWDRIANGAELSFDLAAVASPGWAATPEDAPP